jgi:hypothetical protein
MYIQNLLFFGFKKEFYNGYLFTNLPGYKREKIGVKQTNFKANLSDWALVRA